MPSWKIHFKYAKMLGIPEDIERHFERWLDGMCGGDPSKHDFWRYFVSHELVYGVLKIAIDFGRYRNDMRLMDYIDREFGDAGFKALLLHIVLDKIADILRANWKNKGEFPVISQVIISIYDSSVTWRKLEWYYDRMAKEIEMLVNNNLNLILQDIKEEITEKVIPTPRKPEITLTLEHLK